MADNNLPQIERVSLRSRTGRGGMADVYLGVHETLQRPVAVKILHSHLVEDEDVRRRFHAEARAVSGLRHANIVQVYDFGLLDGRPYIIMEFIEGHSLAGLLQDWGRRGLALPVDQVVALTVGVASALDYAHARGIIHRDVKPANILLRGPWPGDRTSAHHLEPFEAVLSDFGVARLAQSTAATLSGTLLGTPAYMGPEQVLGGPIDARTDIYSLGVVLYEMITGGLPFRAPAESPAAMLFQHVHESPPRLPDESAPFQSVIDRALAKDPGERYLTAGDLVDHLRHELAGGPAKSTGVIRNRATRRLDFRSAATSKRTRMPRAARLGLLALIALFFLAGGSLALPRLLPGLIGNGQGTANAPTSSELALDENGGPVATATAQGITAATGSASATASDAPGQQNTLSAAATGNPTPTPSATSIPVRSATPRPSATPTSSPTATPQPSPTATDLLDPILTPPLLDL